MSLYHSGQQKMEQESFFSQSYKQCIELALRCPSIDPCLRSGPTESHLSPNALAVSDHVMGRLTLFIVIITKKIDQLLLTSLLILCAENQNQTIWVKLIPNICICLWILSKWMIFIISPSPQPHLEGHQMHFADLEHRLGCP